MASVVFILQRDDRRVLMESRGPDDKYFPNGTIYPGGKVEPGEHVYPALIREIGEELGVQPWATYRLANDRHLYYLPVDDAHQTHETAEPCELFEAFEVHAYIIRGWYGEVPDAILDTGHKLEWRTLEEARTGHGCTEAITDAIVRFTEYWDGKA